MEIKKKVIFEVLLITIITYFTLLTILIIHEEGHKQIYSENGINSYYTINYINLTGHTLPVDIDCTKDNCIKLIKLHDDYENDWGNKQ